MTVLLWLTLAYAAVLVLALAAGLVTVWLRLRGIDRALGSARRSLVEVEDGTRGLDAAMDPLVDRLLATVESLDRAASELSQADQRVRERSGAAAAGGAE